MDIDHIIQLETLLGFRKRICGRWVAGSNLIGGVQLHAKHTVRMMENVLHPAKSLSLLISVVQLG